MPRKSTLRREILRLLEPGEWTSGEGLAEALGVSRAAVSRHMSLLRSEGSIIDAAPRRGYRLVSLADPWEGGDMPQMLRTSCLGKAKWLWLAETDSTDLALLREALSGTPCGTVAVARHQREGRGSRGRTWTDMPGCLMSSVLLRPPLKPATSRDMLEAALACCCSALEAVCGVHAVQKHPNDILLNGRKIGGLLVESLFRNSDLACAVLGMGINVNVPPAAMPDALRGKASSVYAESGRTASLSALLAAILERLEPALLDFAPPS